jgi:mRNA interferase MazF
MVIQQGEIWWADLDAPVGSTAGFRRPVLIVQCNSFNRSRISTTVCVPLTSNLKWADAPGNVRLLPRYTGLDRESVANVSLIVSINKSVLTELVGRLPHKHIAAVLAGIDVVLGR